MDAQQILNFPIWVRHASEQNAISQTVVERCLRIAVDALEGKRDRDGNALILHSLIVGSMGQTEAEKCLGFLHDVVEDTEWTFDDLIREGVPKEVVEAAMLCTHSKDEDYDVYIQRIIDSKNPTVIHVKLNDLRHNLARGKAYGYDRLVAKHSKALQRIEQALKEI